MLIKIKKLSTTAQIPTRGSDEAAGWDLYADRSAILYPGDTAKISTGISMEIPPGHFGAVYARSGLAIKHGLRPANCVGIIDSDYRGDLIVSLHNDSEKTADIHTGDRIAQLIIQPYVAQQFIEVDELSSTERGSGALGHTGR